MVCVLLAMPAEQRARARRQVDAAKKRAAAAKAAERRAKASRGWVGWLWGGGGGGGTAAAAGGAAKGEADEDAEMRGDLTPEDEEALKELSNEQEAALRLGALLHAHKWVSETKP